MRNNVQEIIIIYACARVCVHACVRVCACVFVRARAHARVCVYVCMLQFRCNRAAFLHHYKARFP